MSNNIDLPDIQLNEGNYENSENIIEDLLCIDNLSIEYNRLLKVLNREYEHFKHKLEENILILKLNITALVEKDKIILSLNNSGCNNLKLKEQYQLLIYNYGKLLNKFLNIDYIINGKGLILLEKEVYLQFKKLLESINVDYLVKSIDNIKKDNFSIKHSLSISYTLLNCILNEISRLDYAITTISELIEKTNPTKLIIYNQIPDFNLYNNNQNQINETIQQLTDIIIKVNRILILDNKINKNLSLQSLNKSNLLMDKFNSLIFKLTHENNDDEQ